MSLDFDKYAAKGNEIVNMLAEDLVIHKDNAGRILRAVLHALRKRLTLEESFQLISQLPMALKGIYIDGWKVLANNKRISHLKEFLDEIRHEDGLTAGYDFGNDERAKIAVSAVFRTLQFFISKGEMEDIVSVLPNEIKKFVKSTIGENRSVL